MKVVKIPSILFLLAIFGAFIVGYSVYPFKNSTVTQKEMSEKVISLSEEIELIKKSQSLDEKVKIYKKLIERAGAEEAQEQLQHSGFPFDGETHLLNHTVGDFLYDKYQTKGLVYCKDYFLSSCYHGFVIRAMADGGLEKLTEVMDNCWKVGERVAIQCAHAIGHGFLAFNGYKNFVKALADCDSLSEQSKKFPNFNCHDGTFMENIFAVHEDGKPSADRWLKEDDPIYPCNEEKIPQKYIRACWSNQPSWMYQLFQGNLQKVAQQCLNLTNLEYQNTCFDALARQIHPLTNGSVDQSFALCSLMPGPWIDPCLVSISKAFFSVGDRIAPFEICGKIHAESKNNCYRDLSTIINLYSKNTKEKDNACRKIVDKEWISRCLTAKITSTF